MHRLWYDLRNQSMFEPSLREVVLEIDGQLEAMIWRVITRYADLAGAAPRSTATTLRHARRALREGAAGAPDRHCTALPTLHDRASTLLPSLIGCIPGRGPVAPGQALRASIVAVSPERGSRHTTRSLASSRRQPSPRPCRDATAAGRVAGDHLGEAVLQPLLRPWKRHTPKQPPEATLPRSLPSRLKMRTLAS